MNRAGASHTLSHRSLRTPTGSEGAACAFPVQCRVPAPSAPPLPPAGARLTWITTMSLSNRVGSKPFSKTRCTEKVCRVGSRRRRSWAPSTTCTDRKFLWAAEMGEEGRWEEGPPVAPVWPTRKLRAGRQAGRGDSQAVHTVRC